LVKGRAFVFWAQRKPQREFFAPEKGAKRGFQGGTKRNLGGFLDYFRGTFGFGNENLGAKTSVPRGIKRENLFSRGPPPLGGGHFKKPPGGRRDPLGGRLRIGLFFPRGGRSFSLKRGDFSWIPPGETLFPQELGGFLHTRGEKSPRVKTPFLNTTGITGYPPGVT